MTSIHVKPVDLSLVNDERYTLNSGKHVFSNYFLLSIRDESTLHPITKKEKEKKKRKRLSVVLVLKYLSSKIYCRVSSMYLPDIPDLDHIQNFMTFLHIFEFRFITMIHLDKTSFC